MLLVMELPSVPNVRVRRPSFAVWEGVLFSIQSEAVAGVSYMLRLEYVNHSSHIAAPSAFIDGCF